MTIKLVQSKTAEALEICLDWMENLGNKEAESIEDMNTVDKLMTAFNM